MKYVLLIMILLVGCSTPTPSMTISSDEEYNALGMFDYEGNILKWEKDYLNKELVFGESYLPTITAIQSEEVFLDYKLRRERREDVTSYKRDISLLSIYCAFGEPQKPFLATQKVGSKVNLKGIISDVPIVIDDFETEHIYEIRTYETINLVHIKLKDCEFSSPQ